MAGSPLWQFNTLKSLVAISTVVVEVFLVVEGQDSTCTRLNSPLMFISKAHGIRGSLTQKISGRRQKFASVPNEGLPILVIHVYNNN